MILDEANEFLMLQYGSLVKTRNKLIIGLLLQIST